MFFTLIRSLSFVVSILLLSAAMPEGNQSFAQSGGSVQKAERIIVKQRRQRTKHAKRSQSSALKAHWARQSKAAKKTIKRSNRRNRKMLKLKRKANRERERLSRR